MNEKLQKQEACQLYIEQEIESGLERGATPYSIGKEIAVWVEKLFEAKIPSRTIEQRTRRIQNETATFVANDLTTGNDSGNEEKPDKPVIIRNEQGQFSEGTKIAGPGRPPKFKVIQPTIANQMTGDFESYTPSKYIESARKVMGSIDIDPASNEFANKKVMAKTFYDLNTDGLKNIWEGNVFINPPYKQPEIKYFIEKLLNEIELQRVKQAILLTNNNTDTQWFKNAANKAGVICFTTGRINFYKLDGKETQPTNGQAFFYFGDKDHIFAQEFRQYGLVMKIWG